MKRIVVLAIVSMLGLTPAAGAVTSGQGDLPDDEYTALVLVCVYADDADACAELEAAGYSPDEGYGLGNSLSQAPSEALETDCTDGDRLSCAELSVRVIGGYTGTDSQALMCLSYRYVGTQAEVPPELFALNNLLGADAPPGVLDGLDVIATGNGDLARALDSLNGYLTPVCGQTRQAPVRLKSDRKVGEFVTTIPDGGTLAHAYEAFGPPNAMRRDADVCEVFWDAIGLQMTFANLGGDDACVAETGFFTVAHTSGDRWVTDKGLAVGDGVGRLQRKYPKARRDGRRNGRTVWVLVSQPVPDALGGGRDPRLVALVALGQITGFEVRQSNAGE